MESFHKLIAEAKRAFDTADHLMYVTYPLLKESKLIVTITEHINMALQNAVKALFEYERMYKRISYIPEEFMTKMEMLKSSILPRYKLERYAGLIMDVREIINNRKQASMEFMRKNKYMIYSNGYTRVNAVSIDNIKNYLVHTRSFIEGITRAIGENGRKQG